MPFNRREIKIKNIEFLSDSIVCEIEPINGNLFLINYIDIHKKDVSPEKFILTKGETKLPFHTKRHLPEYYKHYKENYERGFKLNNYDKKTFVIGEIIGEAIELK